MSAQEFMPTQIEILCKTEQAIAYLFLTTDEKKSGHPCGRFRITGHATRAHPAWYKTLPIGCPARQQPGQHRWQTSSGRSPCA